MPTASATAHIDNATTRRCHTGSTTTTGAGRTARSETAHRSAVFTTSVGRTARRSVRRRSSVSCAPVVATQWAESAFTAPSPTMDYTREPVLEVGLRLRRSG